jgi:multidrug efflux pump
MKWVAKLLANSLLVYIASLVICLFGIACLFFIPIAPFPKIAFNQFSIRMSYPGANAYTVQKQVTEKVENELQGIDNIERISTTSQDGSARIKLVLNSIKTDDLLQTQIKISQAIAASDLPAIVPQPSVDQNSGSSSLIAYMISSEKLTPFEVSNFIQARILPTFKSIPGVSVFSNSFDPTIKIQIHPEALAKYKLNIQTLATRVNSAFQSQPLGTLTLGQYPYLLGVKSSIAALQDLKNLIVGYSGKNKTIGNPILLKNVATISLAPRQLTTDNYTGFNGRPGQQIQLYTTSTANPFTVSQASHKFIHQITPSLPSDLKITEFQNMAENMHDSFSEVVITILIASVLVLLIAMIFLGHFRSTLIPIITIPVCLLGAIGIISTLGYSLNILSLLAMVIAVGLVVDDSIVVVENITRYLEQGFCKHDAIMKGTSDIALTIVGITATLLAVYLPISFYQSDTIVMFKAFTVPLAAAVFISGIIALTLTPVMCVSFLPNHGATKYQQWFNRLLTAMITGYHKILNFTLKRPLISLLILASLIVSGIHFDLKIPQTIFPNDPSGYVIVQINGNAQDTIDTLKNVAKKFSPFYKDKKTKNTMTSIYRDSSSGLLQGYIFLQLKPAYLQLSQAFTDKINKFIKDNNIQNTLVLSQNISNWGGNYDLTFSLYGNVTQSYLNQKATLFTDALKKSSLFNFASNTIVQPSKQLIFSINEPLAAKYGLYRNDITQQLAIAFGGSQFNNHFSIAGLSVPIVMQLDRSSLQDPKTLENLQIQSPINQKYYPLSQFVSLHLAAVPSAITTINGQPSVTLNASLSSGHSLGEAIAFVNQQLSAIAPNVSIQYSGNAEKYIEGNTQTLLILILGLVAIYFLLTIIFKNIVDPFIIMLTVPFSVVSGALSLYIFNGTIDLYSSLALITLIGLITKHGVLIVQFANQELQKGANKMAAIFTATHHRFRPIVMTTLAMMLGALPLILSQGQMYVARRELGMVLISGLLIGTVFSLFIVPLAYTLIKRDKTSP